MTELQEFVSNEMKRRGMSMREFADFVGVSHVTISRVLDPSRAEYQGDIEFLVKLSKATKVSITSIVALAYPALATETKDISAQVLAEQIQQLPDAMREAVLAIIRGAPTK